MKWYRRSSHTPDPGRPILACFIEGDSSFGDGFGNGLQIYRRVEDTGEIKCDYWAYQDQVDLQKDIIENLCDSKKTTIQQYTGKRLISI